MKIRQQGILYALALFAVILISAGAEAATNTWGTPSAGNSPVTGATQTLEVSVGADNAVTNMTFYFEYANATRLFIAEAVNGTNNATSFNVTWDTTGIIDQDGITLNATAWSGDNNDTMDNSAVLQGIHIDNTVPTLTYGTVNPAAGATRDNSSATFATAADNSIVNCTLSSVPAFNTTAGMTILPIANACVLQVNNIPNYAYTYNWSITDGVNVSTFATRSLIIQTSEGSYIPAVAGAIEQAETTSKRNYGWIVIIAAIAVFVYNRNKK